MTVNKILGTTIVFVLLLGTSMPQEAKAANANGTGINPAITTLLLLSPDVVQVFVTSESFDGNLGGIDGADTKCADAASAAGLGGNWKAWISDNATNASMRIIDAQYQLLDGTVVANNLDDLTDGKINAPIDLDEIVGTGGTHVVQVFVTSESFDGNLGGIDGADTQCTSTANTAGYGGNWKAWISDSTRNARDRIPDGEYQLLNGTIVANNLIDLTDDTLDVAINLDEKLATVTTNADVWTATATDGINQGFGSCSSWSTSDNAERGRIGRSTSDDSFWTDVGGGSPCDSTRRLYCFSAKASSEVWTSTAEDGINQGFGSCVNWSTTSLTNSGRVGESTAVDATWTSLGGRTCDMERRLYCFSGGAK